MPYLNHTEQLLVTAIAWETSHGKNNPTIHNLLKRGDVNWDHLRKTLIYHGLAPFAHIALKKYESLVPQESYRFLELAYRYALTRVFQLKEEFLSLHAAFAKGGVTVLPFKGTALVEELYAHAPVRPSLDIDILLRHAHLDAAVVIMETLGYEKNLGGKKESYWRGQYHLGFKKKGGGRVPILVELHWDIDYPRKGITLLPKKFERTRKISVSGNQIEILSPEDTFIGLALHQRRFGSVLNIRDACDMARLLQIHETRFDWGYVLCESKNAGLETTIYFALCQINFLFGNTPDMPLLKALSVSPIKKRLIPRFIARNTFTIRKETNLKNLYLRTHFLLYNSFWDPFKYIVNIPQEQFAEYYGMAYYSRKARLTYRIRVGYILLRLLWKSQANQ